MAPTYIPKGALIEFQKTGCRSKMIKLQEVPLLASFSGKDVQVQYSNMSQRLSERHRQRSTEWKSHLYLFASKQANSFLDPLCTQLNFLECVTYSLGFQGPHLTF